MNTCESYAALLDAFAEGDLFTEDMVQVQQHLLNVRVLIFVPIVSFIQPLKKLKPL